MPKISRRDLLAVSALAVGAMTLRVAPVSAATSTSGVKALPSAYGYKIGSINVIAVFDGVRKGPLEPAFVTNVPFEQVREAFAEAMRPTETIENPFTPTLIRTGDRLVLIDTGNGVQTGGGTVGRLLDSMKGAGFAPEQVDLVIISHFHGDHISGLRTPEGQPVFANAEVLVPERELSFWLDKGEESRAAESRKRSFAVARRIFGTGGLRTRTYRDGEELAPGVTAVAAHGHSPGHMAFRVQSGSDGLLLLSDAAHLPFLFVRNPEWSPAADMDPQMARETRRRLLDQASADRIPVAGYHWGLPNVGHVRQAGSGFDLIRIPWPS
jgi:glyoxylase-like metal-dependent hydrolase (beta-lactamase superfamily II)